MTMMLAIFLKSIRSGVKEYDEIVGVITTHRAIMTTKIKKAHRNREFQRTFLSVCGVGDELKFVELFSRVIFDIFS